MDITLGQLNKLSIKRLKDVLKKLSKEPKNVETLSTIDIIKNLIRDKKRKGLILHPEWVNTTQGVIREEKCNPVHFMTN